MTTQLETESEPLTTKEIIDSIVIMLEDLNIITREFIKQEVERRLEIK
jgi:hypothetical protein